MYNHNKQ